jgi:hypothetical protein
MVSTRWDPKTNTDVDHNYYDIVLDNKEVLDALAAGIDLPALRLRGGASEGEGEDARKEKMKRLIWTSKSEILELRILMMEFAQHAEIGCSSLLTGFVRNAKKPQKPTEKIR